MKPTSSSRFSTLPSRFLPYATFVLLAVVSWNRWIEPYVDSGRELMVPWRIAHGERLYGDVHFHHGPLGPYVAAAVDTAFGRSLPARVALAAAIALLHLAGLSALSRRMLTGGRAALAVSAAVAAAVFLRPGGWMFPFSFDTAIAVATLTWSVELFLRGSDSAAAACLLAALLSRPEMGAVGAALLAFSARSEPRRLARLVAAPIVLAAAGYAAVSAGIPRARLVADGWLRLIDPPDAFRNVYRSYAGLDRPGLRILELALAVIVLAVVAAFLIAASAVSARVASRSPFAAHAIAGGAVLLLTGAAAWRFAPSAGAAEQLDLIPPLVRVVPPLVVAAALVRGVAVLLLPRRESREVLPEPILWLAAFFSVRLLLAAGYIGPYDSFFLPLPIVAAAAGGFAVADRLAPRIGASLPGLAGAALAVFALFRVARNAEQYRGRPWQAVSTPAGSLSLPAPLGSATGAALADLDRRLPLSGTLAGFPEAGFYNYVLGRRNPLRLEQFFPGHLDAAAEGETAEILQRTPPDAVLLANVLAVGEGTRAFGTDYLTKLDAAARSRFERAAIFGPGASAAARIGDPGFFVEILVPRAPSVAAGAR